MIVTGRDFLNQVLDAFNGGISKSFQLHIKRNQEKSNVQMKQLVKNGSGWLLPLQTILDVTGR